VDVCLAAGADAMEIDVRLAADDVPVLMHDETVDRTTNLRGRVRDLTAGKLERADAGNGAGVPSLAAVLDRVAGRLTVACELKRATDDAGLDAELVDRVVAVIAGHQAQGWTAIHSFDPAIVARARATAPELPAAFIAVPHTYGTPERLFEAALRAG